MSFLTTFLTTFLGATAHVAIDSTQVGKNVSMKTNASKDLEFAETELVPMSTEDSTAHAQMDMLQVKSIFSQKAWAAVYLEFA